jgi:NADH-quinone oxidoreductase subunit H
MAEYGSMLAVSLLASILFLGGWHGPLPVASWLGLTFENGWWWGIAGNVLGTLNMLVKGIVGVTVMMWVRWTLPRLRIDQVITTCLKYCVPIAAVAFLGATLWQYALPNGLVALVAPASQAASTIEERWPDATGDAPQAAPANDQSAEDGVRNSTASQRRAS